LNIGLQLFNTKVPVRTEQL